MGVCRIMLHLFKFHTVASDSTNISREQRCLCSQRAGPAPPDSNCESVKSEGKVWQRNVGSRDGNMENMESGKVARRWCRDGARGEEGRGERCSYVKQQTLTLTQQPSRQRCSDVTYTDLLPYISVAHTVYRVRRVDPSTQCLYLEFAYFSVCV